MKRKLIIFCFLFSQLIFSATRTWKGGTDTNWGTTTNWNEGAVPTSADDVVIDASPTNGITLNTSSRVCKSIDFTNFGTKTFTMTNGLTVSGSVKLISTMTIAGSATLTVNGTATMTSAGLTFPNALTFSPTTGSTITFADDWTVNGLVTTSVASVGSATYTGQTIHCKGGYAFPSGVSRTATGTTAISIEGTGTLGGIGICSLAITLVSGTITFLNGTMQLGSGGSMTYSGGTLVFTGNTCQINGSYTMSGFGGIQFNAISLDVATQTLTLNFTLLVTTITFNELSNGVYTISGGGITAGTWTMAVAGTNVSWTVVLDRTKTYTVTTALNDACVRSTANTIKSNSAGNQVTFILQAGATQNLRRTIATDLLSSGGQTIWVYDGTLSNATNWRLLTAPPANSAWVH